MTGIFKTFLPPSSLQHIHSTNRYKMSFMYQALCLAWGYNGEEKQPNSYPSIHSTLLVGNRYSNYHRNKKLHLVKNSINNWRISVPFPPFFTISLISHSVIRGGECNRMCPFFKPCRF